MCCAFNGRCTKIKNFSCVDQFLCMAFAQLTYRESLRDIESCLRFMQSKLYHMGIRGRYRKARLVDQFQRKSRLAYLRRLCASVDSARPRIISQRTFWRRTGTNSLRVGRDNDRSLPIVVPLGPLERTKEQSSCTRFWICVAASHRVRTGE